MAELQTTESDELAVSLPSVSQSSELHTSGYENHVSTEQSEIVSAAALEEPAMKDESYFDAEALATELKSRQSMALQAERDDTYSPMTTEVTTVTTPPCNETKMDNTRTPGPDVTTTKKTPGWKGWLRSASSSSSVPFRLDLGRKSGHSQQQSPTRSEHTAALSRVAGDLEEHFDRLRLSADVEGSSIDWPFYGAIVRGEPMLDASAGRRQIRSGIPDSLRGLIWQSLAKSRSSELELMYNQLLIEPSCDFEKQIRKDVGRISRTWEKQLKKEL